MSSVGKDHPIFNEKYHLVFDEENCLNWSSMKKRIFFFSMKTIFFIYEEDDLLVFYEEDDFLVLYDGDDP